jgi:hypothetical protein
MLSHGGAASNSSSSLTQSSTGGGAHSHAPLLPGGGALTAADIALRGRKAKKRGGRVHVMLGASGSGGSGGGGGGGSGGSHAVHGPASTGSSRGRGASLASPSPYVYPLDFLSAAPPVIVCVSTLPSRVHHIDKTLNSIKTQNYPIAQMLLVIPEESRRERTKYSIPDRVRKDAILSVVRVSHDYGPATALISAWAAAAAADPSADNNHAFLGHRDTMIIRLDDDMVYHPDTVATLVRHALAHPDSAVGFAGYSLRGPPYGQPNLQFAKRREERTDIQWRNTQQALQHQINYAAATAPPGSSVALAAAAAAAAAAHASSSSYSSHLLSPSLDPSLLPVFDPLPDVCLESDPYLSPLPNPNDVYDTELVDVLQSWRGGMLVRKRFLDERMWKEYADAPSDAAMEADDEWVSAQLARNGVARRVILAPFDVRHSSAARSEHMHCTCFLPASFGYLICRFLFVAVCAFLSSPDDSQSSSSASRSSQRLCFPHRASANHARNTRRTGHADAAIGVGSRIAAENTGCGQRRGRGEDGAAGDHGR